MASGKKNIASLLPDESSVVLLVVFNAVRFFRQLCCIFRISVNCADAVPLKEECIENIASNLGEEMP